MTWPAERRLQDLHGALVTGANGFIGGALLRELAARRLAPRALLGPEASPSAAKMPGVEFVRGDIQGYGALRAALRSAGIVFHLAGPPSVADSFRRPGEHWRVHADGTAALVAACNGVRRVVYASSAEVYGPTERAPIDETHTLAPRSPYGEAKVAAERALRRWSDARIADVAVLRLFSVYGPRRNDRSVIGDLVAQARSGQSLRPFSLTPVRDFCHINDIVSALLAAGTAPLSTRYRIFNIGTGLGVSIGALARTIAEVSGQNLPVIPRETTDRPVDRDLSYLVADPGRAQRELYWRAHTPLHEGLMRTLAQLEGIDED